MAFLRLYIYLSLSVLVEVICEAGANQSAPEGRESQDDPVAKDGGAVGVEEGSAAQRLEVDRRQRQVSDVTLR